MLPGPTLSVSEVLPVDRQGNPNPAFPADRQCKSGHQAAEGVRFFMVAGDTLAVERHGIYCEDCLIAANKLVNKHQLRQKFRAQAQRQRNPFGFDPD